MELMRIPVWEPKFCSGSTGWHFCWESLDQRHNLLPWMQKWWESPYEIQNFENLENNTFRHSGRPKWNQHSTEGSLKKQIAKKKWNHVHTAQASCQISSECFVILCRPAWQAEKPQKVKFKHRCKKPYSLNCQPVKRESAQQQKPRLGRNRFPNI